MSIPYLSELRLFSFNFAPKGWAFCNGQTLPINQNQALFSLLGTTYGGDGITTFKLPNLQGRVPLHMSSAFTLGSTGGEENHTLLQSEMPTHTHSAMADAAAAGATFTLPNGKLPANAAPTLLYSAAGTNVSMAAQMVATAGSGQPHPNQQPYLALNYCIALQGIFPSRN